MLNKSFLFLTLFCTILISCDNYKKTKGGLEYKLVEDKEGKNAEIGGMIVLHVRYENEIDTFNTYKRGSPISAVLDSVTMYPGSLEEGLVFLSPGDSAIFKVKNKTLYKETFKQPVPEKLDSNGVTVFYVKVDTVFSRAEVVKEQKLQIDQQTAVVEAYKAEMLDSAHVKKQLAADDKLIQEYIKKKNLKTSKTPSGVYVSIIDSGKGESIKKGQRVYTKYVGKLLDDKIFQASDELGRDFDFVVGAGQAVMGWDEATEGLKKGAKAILVIPSPLAYGKKGIPLQGVYLIPPDSPVVFEVEIMRIDKIQ
jgi:FKBP-type peptidyl-prolyl cis-trans isomerase FkpA